MAVVVAKRPVGVTVLVSNEYIEVAADVLAEPDRADGLARIADAGGDRHIREAPAVVAKQAIRLVAKGDEEVEVAVVVVVDPRDLARHAREVEPERRRDVEEVSPAVVVIALVRRVPAEPDVQIDGAITTVVAPPG